MAVPVLTYGSGCCIITHKDKSYTQVVEMKFLSMLTGDTKQDRIRNENIVQELNIY